ncbi:hypothetical protein GFGA_1c1449 [Gluconobacter frateurii NBRC 103465]|nr:hypothetical protein GFGA_1c1449 [Gluconobacter frateurii NBRC 103465]
MRPEPNLSRLFHVPDLLCRYRTIRGISVGAWGALIMSFFGAVFASLTLYWHLNFSGIALAFPFLSSLLIGLAAMYVIRLPGDGIKPNPKEERAIMWSSIGHAFSCLRWLWLSGVTSFPLLSLGASVRSMF